MQRKLNCVNYLQKINTMMIFQLLLLLVSSSLWSGNGAAGQITDLTTEAPASSDLLTEVPGTEGAMIGVADTDLKVPFIVVPDDPTVTDSPDITVSESPSEAIANTIKEDNTEKTDQESIAAEKTIPSETAILEIETAKIPETIVMETTEVKKNTTEILAPMQSTEPPVTTENMISGKDEQQGATETVIIESTTVEQGTSDIATEPTTMEEPETTKNVEMKTEATETTTTEITMGQSTEPATGGDEVPDAPGPPGGDEVVFSACACKDQLERVSNTLQESSKDNFKLLNIFKDIIPILSNIEKKIGDKYEKDGVESNNGLNNGYEEDSEPTETPDEEHGYQAPDRPQPLEDPNSKKDCEPPQPVGECQHVRKNSKFGGSYLKLKCANCERNSPNNRKSHGGGREEGKCPFRKRNK